MVFIIYKGKFRRINELYVKDKFIKLIEENVVEYFCDLWLKKDFKKYK